MRIAIIGSRGIPASYGGFETFAEQLSLRLVQRGLDVAVTCDWIPPAARIRIKGIDLRWFPLRPFWRTVYEPGSDAANILSLAHSVDCILALGYAGSPSFPLASWSGTPIVVNVDGLEWKRDKFSRPSKGLLRLNEGIAVKTSSAVVADSMRVKEYLDAKYRIDSHFIPYGADHCTRSDRFESSVIARSSKEHRAPLAELERGSYYLAVARLEPENSVEMIVRAFRRLRTSKRLVVVGGFRDTDYRRRVLAIAAKDPRIVFPGPIYDHEALDMLRSNCRAYIHGHTVGGTNPALIEAMYLGAPVVAFDTEFNREAGGETIRYFASLDSLARLLEELEESPTIGREMVGSATSRVQSAYTWERVTSDYISVFEEVLS